MAKEIRERIVISELVESLTPEDEASIDLLKSALLIARLDNEHFDLNNYLRKADLLAEKIKTKFPDDSGNSQKIKILVYQLFEEMGFHGSTIDSHHRSNSYINEVMDDREGLPITLCILFMELAKRLDLNVTGLGLPGHFLALYKGSQMHPMKSLLLNPIKKTEIIIDAYEIINRKEASRLTAERSKHSISLHLPKKTLLTDVEKPNTVAEKEKTQTLRPLSRCHPRHFSGRSLLTCSKSDAFISWEKGPSTLDINFLLEDFLIVRKTNLFELSETA